LLAQEFDGGKNVDITYKKRKKGDALSRGAIKEDYCWKGHRGRVSKFR